MKRYRLTKIDTASDALHDTAETIQQYRDNLFNSNAYSPPVDYYVEGIPFDMPQINKSFLMYRENRNGIKVPGVFTSSPVSAISTKDGKYIFTTNNSVYLMEELNSTEQ
jgi:hypothetical protein